MKVSEAISMADGLRANTIDVEVKVKWLNEVDCDVAQMQGVLKPDIVWPQKDAQLLMPAPYDNIYVLYLIAQYDYYSEESALYANDSQIYNNALDSAKAWWRRNNVPTIKAKAWEVI